MGADGKNGASGAEARPAIQLAFSRTTVVEAMTHIPLLPDHVEMVVGADGRDTYLFARSLFCGSTAGVARLRRLIEANETVDVTLRAHATLLGLSAAPRSVMDLVLGPPDAPRDP